MKAEYMWFIGGVAIGVFIAPSVRAVLMPPRAAA